MEAATSNMSPPQTLRTDLDEPISQQLYAHDQQKGSQAPQDVEMGVGGDSQEMFFSESQTDDGGVQICGAQEFTYKNTILDITSPWAQSWRRHDIEGGEVFYHPGVSLTIEPHKLNPRESYCSTS